VRNHFTDQYPPHECHLRPSLNHVLYIEDVASHPASGQQFGFGDGM
jgi:hypothetical protein